MDTRCSSAAASDAEGAIDAGCVADGGAVVGSAWLGSGLSVAVLPGPAHATRMDAMIRVGQTTCDRRIGVSYVAGCGVATLPATE